MFGQKASSTSAAILATSLMVVAVISVHQVITFSDDECSRTYNELSLKTHGNN